MSKLQDALKALKPATGDNDSPALQSEYDALRQENARLTARVEQLEAEIVFSDQYVAALRTRCDDRRDGKEANMNNRVANSYDKGQCLNNLPQRWAEAWSLSGLEYELRRRGLDWAILNDTLTEYQRKKIATIVIVADLQIRACPSNHKTAEADTEEV